MKKAMVFAGEETDIKADSLEVMAAYYASQLLGLEKELNQLNILDHPCQIQGICKNMQEFKSKIILIDSRKNRKLI